MKKLLLSSVLVAFALAVQAGDAKVSKDQKSAKDESPCCSAKTTQTSTAAKTTVVSTDKEKMSCCSGSVSACKEMPSKRVLLSPKAAEMARK
jgi:hypothetical protein